jgi:POT family proton-dependent oligopeptide transporter
LFRLIPAQVAEYMLKLGVIDQYLGKFKTIIWSTPIYFVGMITLVVTSTPMAINAGASMGGLIAAMIMIGLGTGGLKACIAPMCGEQSPMLKSYVQVNPKTGEREVVDIGLSSARVFMWYYWAANLGTLSSLGTTSLEKVHSFWIAYLMPLV